MSAPTGKTFVIRRLDDIADIPDDRFDAFVVDLRRYVKLRRQITVRQPGGLLGWLGFKRVAVTTKFAWNDDGSTTDTIRTSDGISIEIK